MTLPFENNPALFEDAKRYIQAHIAETPTAISTNLSHRTKGDVYLKLESAQRTGSFKIRGVTKKILSLDESDRQKTLIAASTGNHGAAFLHMVNKFGIDGKLFVPTTINDEKRAAIEDLGLPYELYGNDCMETELYAKKRAMEMGGIFVGPYNDPDIILGQGTVAVEIFAQVRDIDAVIVPVGGGGLISGMATYLKAVSPRTRIIGAQPQHSPVMMKSIEAGRIVNMESLPTLADATAGGIEPGAITFELCQRYVDEFVSVTESDIESALRFMLRTEKKNIEGGAALSVAAFRKNIRDYENKTVVLVISGNKLDSS